MFNSKEIRIEKEDSKWTIWDTINLISVNRDIKSAKKKKEKCANVYYIRENVKTKLTQEGYNIGRCACLGMSWDVIMW